MSVQENLPQRRPVTLTQLKKFRECFKMISGKQSLLSPQLFPVASGMKIEFTKNNSAEHVSQAFEATSQSKFEPPDPFTT